MKENKKAILDILKKKSKKDGKFENLVLNLALQKIDSDSFEFDGDAVYTNDKKRLVYCMSQEASFAFQREWRLSARWRSAARRPSRTSSSPTA